MPRINPSTRVCVVVALVGLVVVQAGCATGRSSGSAGDRTYAHAVEYRVTCSPRSECRIRYVAEDGSLKNETVVGEWKIELGADPGTRLWLQAAGGGCPPATIRASIWLDGETRAEKAESPDPSVRCQWLTAEAAYEVP
jgi:hypothetical protein